MDLIEQLKVRVEQSDIRMRPPTTIAKVRDFESQAGIVLPRDYVDFILRIGNGAFVPNQLVPLERWFECYWIDAPKLDVALSQGCIVTPDAEQHGEQWIDAQNVARWEERFDDNEWDPMFGSIAISPIGCGLYYSMVVDGPYKGRVFTYGDRMENPPRFVTQESFLDWVQSYFGFNRL